MNYYIQGNKENAEKIKAAFMEKGLIVCGHNFDDKSYLYFTYNLEGGGKVISSTNINLITANLIKRLAELGDYTELELPVEPKFKVGDWVVGNEGIFKITQYEEEYGYYLTDTTGRVAHFISPDYVESNFHLWTIDDAKDGDMLTDGKLIVIFNKFEEPSYKQHIIAHIGLDLCGRLQITEDTWQLGVDKAMPATKEQRDLLFKKMKESGYQWDVDKKELRKIKPHYDIANFKPIQWVLVRNCDNQVWGLSMFSHRDMGCYICLNREDFTQCIPFEGNEHLLGTSDLCDEQYINW